MVPENNQHHSSHSEEREELLVVGIGSSILIQAFRTVTLRLWMCKFIIIFLTIQILDSDFLGVSRLEIIY